MELASEWCGVKGWSLFVNNNNECSYLMNLSLPTWNEDLKMYKVI